MKSAIKALFEQAKSQITNLNINAAILVATMAELVRDYIAEGNLELAFEASKITGNPADQRLVFDACRDVTPHSEKVGMGGFMEAFKQKYFLFHVLLASGTEEELRDAAKSLEKCGYLESSNVIQIYTRLNDTDAILRFGKKVAKSYFSALAMEKKLRVINGGTSSIPHYALQIFEAAKKLGAKRVNQELIKFGDKLFAVTGELEVLHFDSSRDEKTPEVIRAYELAGTKPALKKAAEGYLVIKRPAAAARCFSKIGDSSRTAELIQQIVQSGKLLEAVMLRASLINEPISGFELEQFVGTTAGVAKTKVVETISAYLDTRSNDEPFPTSHTFWHYSDSNVDEWNEYLHTVHSMASRTDTHFRRPFPSIAKELYSTSNAPVIAQIHRALQRHLLVGYMLSAVAMEVDGRCPNHKRKYEHAFDAAIRTFQNGVNGGSYNPFDKGLNFKADPDMSALLEVVLEFQRQELAAIKEFGGEQGLRHNRQSHSFLREKSPELQSRVRLVYQKLAGDVRVLLAQLK